MSFDLSVLRMAGAMATHSAERHALISRNIANADTPGYKARDVDFHSVLKAHTQPGEVQKTHQNHLPAVQMRSDAEVMYRIPLMPSLDGNTVDSQMEQSAFAENSVHFLTTLRILNGRISGMMTAIKGE